MKHVIAHHLDELRLYIQDAVAVQGTTCNLNHIDVSHVTDMSYLFSGDGSFRHVFADVSAWNVSNVRDAECMFIASTHHWDLSSWKFDSLNHAFGMFFGASPITGWDHWSLSKLHNAKQMFYHVEDPPNISRWDLRMCSDMRKMFSSPTSIPLALPEDVSFERMFLYRLLFDETQWFDKLHRLPIGPLHFFSALKFPQQPRHPDWNNEHEQALHIARSIQHNDTKIALSAFEMSRRLYVDLDPLDHRM